MIPAPGPYLVVLEGPGTGRWLSLAGRDRVRIGRRPDNELVLDDSLVSAHHAEVFRAEEGIWVRDLSTVNGTLVAGRAVRRHRLRYGEQIRIGASVLVLSPLPGDGEALEGADPVAALLDLSGATDEFPTGLCLRCGERLPIDAARAAEDALLCPVCRGREETLALPGDALRQADPGEALGPFRIRSRLGQGGMGTVYRVTDAETGQDRCLKILRPSLAVDDEFVGRLAQEAVVMSQLSHPGIVRFHRIGREGSYFYLVLEYVEGQDLGRLVDGPGGPLSIERARDLAAEVGRALAYAHGRGIIHRDVKPSNLMVEATGRARLSDFGLARILQSTRRLTDTGVILGSIRYSAPELFQDAKRAGPAVDQYGLAATLYFALTGRPPFDRRSLREVLGAGDLTLDPVADLRPEVPESIDRAVLRALSRDPADRFESIDALVDALGPVSG